jgi:hypothetical protein
MAKKGDLQITTINIKGSIMTYEEISKMQAVLRGKLAKLEKSQMARQRQDAINIAVKKAQELIQRQRMSCPVIPMF